MKLENVHCLFEQSGTFKNEFKKLGYNAFDYDILNDFNETDYVIDIYNEIENAYSERESIFDKITSNDLIFAFFPCTRFETQVLLNFRGDNKGMQKWSDTKRLEYDLKLQEELNLNYNIITKLVLVCLKRNIKLVIENPYSTQHYLIQRWALKPKVIIQNRREYGDYYIKPTMFYFVNFEPSNNFIFEARVQHPKKVISKVNNQVERSLISKDFANRFIREFILKGDEK